MKKYTAPFLLVALFVGVSTALAVSSTIYSNFPDLLPSNVPSLGVEAYSMSEIGSQIQLSGADRTNPKVTVMMSSWGCENGGWTTNDCSTTPGATFSHPITLNIYGVNPDNSPGALLKTVTKTFDIPYRPSVDTVHCTGGRWYDGTSCFNGFANTISFDLDGYIMPEKSIVAVAYNTSHRGYAPLGEQACFTESGGCGYDSLNVGLVGAPSVGTVLPSDKDIYQNTSYGGFYCDNGAAGTGTFRLDAGCWEGYLPAIKVDASSALVAPTTKDQCKNDGWKTYNNPVFKNQGDCVSFLESSPKAVGNKK